VTIQDRIRLNRKRLRSPSSRHSLPEWRRELPRGPQGDEPCLLGPAFGERGRDHLLTYGEGPYVHEPVLLGIVDKRFLVRELSHSHPPFAAGSQPSRTVSDSLSSKRREPSSTLPVSPCHHARSVVESAASGMNRPNRNSKPANSRTVLVLGPLALGPRCER
jgi:hypothetical protein